MKNFRISLALSVALTLFTAQNSFACTDFRVTAKDGTILITRSMEFSVPFNSNIRSTPRESAFNTMAPDGKPAMSWHSKYGYVYLDGMNIDRAIDGMNESGLSFEALYLPGYAEYQTVPAGKDRETLPYLSIGDWILGNFKTVDEVRQALPKIYVASELLPNMGSMVFPLHFAIYDASGKGIVVEYIGGKLHIYDNKVGVMTNSPGYDWQTTNLLNYAHLNPVNPEPVKVEGIAYGVNGQGFGMIGLPGDISPPSRFVKTTVLTQVALPVNDASGAVNLAEHIINNVDIPLGLVREPNSGKYMNENTQWVVFKDLTHKAFYYRTYDNMTLHEVSLSQLNFTKNAPHLKMPIEDKSSEVKDMTSEFVTQKTS